MRPSPTPADIRWKRTPEGFSGINGRVLVNIGQKTMTVDGKEYRLPRKPSFDHAEGILQEHFGWKIAASPKRLRPPTPGEIQEVKGIAKGVSRKHGEKITARKGRGSMRGTVMVQADPSLNPKNEGITEEDAEDLARAIGLDLLDRLIAAGYESSSHRMSPSITLKSIRDRFRSHGTSYVNLSVMKEADPSASRVASLYREAADTQQSKRLEKAVKEFGEAVADASRAFEGWQKKEPADGRDGLLGRLRTKGKVLYDLLDIEVEDPYDEARLKKYLRRAANFRRLVKKLMGAKDWEDLESIVKSIQTKSKSAWNKYYEYSTEVQGLIRTFDYEVEATLDAGGFHLVLYQTGLADWDASTIDRLKWVMGEASSLLKKRGLGGIAGGTVFVYPTAKVPGSTGTMAWYRRSDDVMTLAAGSSFFLKKSPSDVLRTVIHELGHRAYYRLVGNRGRRAWEEFFELGKGVPDLNTMIRRWTHYADVDGSKEANRKRHFNTYYPGLKKKHPIEAEWLRIVVDSLGLRGEEKYDSYHGFPTKSSKAALDQLIDRRGEVKVFMEPVTAYSATSASELFAEVFAHYVVYGPRTISGAVRAAFLRALPMLKSGSRGSKKPTRAEEALISAWRFGHITRAQLEEKLGPSRAAEIAPKKK